nr:uncharacterized protein LOC112779809 isoform X2 [Arachis hypogaea]
MAILSLQTPNPIPAITTTTKHLFPFTSRRTLFLQTPFLSIAIALIPQAPLLHSSAQVSPSKPLLSAIENTKSWFQFYGDGFAIRVPPDFQDIMEPEAQDITDLGSLKDTAKIFVPGGATLYAARSIKIKEDDGFRTYYFYEFGRDEQHIALVAGVSGGKAIIAGATAPQSKWDSDGVKLRSAAVSLKIL